MYFFVSLEAQIVISKFFFERNFINSKEPYDIKLTAFRQTQIYKESFYFQKISFFEKI